jgi:protein-arginine kinase activator protein McsA
MKCQYCHAHNASSVILDPNNENGQVLYVCKWCFNDEPNGTGQPKEQPRIKGVCYKLDILGR